MNESCDKCYYFKNENQDGKGLCLRFPPQFISIHEIKASHSGYFDTGKMKPMCMNAETDKRSFCGEFKPMEGG